jgi:hypothetical protein
VQGIKHTSKKTKPVKKFAGGGSTDSIPDPGGAIPSDPNDPGDMQNTSQGQQGQTGDTGQQQQATDPNQGQGGQAGDLTSIAAQVKKVASATRQQFGLTDQAFQTQNSQQQQAQGQQSGGNYSPSQPQQAIPTGP